MQNQTTIIRIPLDKLLPHPENPNRMAKANFEKLKRHIKQSHNYEPLIVRRHPEIETAFQIINGHHRAEALKQIGETFADCVQWDIDDDAARLLLGRSTDLAAKMNWLPKRLFTRIFQKNSASKNLQNYCLIQNRR
jgi:ParB-like chromosome segregation protein Spo0J